MEPPPSRDHCRRTRRSRLFAGCEASEKSGDSGERRRLQGGKAALAEIPKCTVGVKSLAGLISGAILATVADSDYSGDTRCIARDLARFASMPIRMNSGWMPLLRDAPHSPQKRQRD